MDQPSRTFTEEERQLILSRCPSLKEPNEPTKQLLASLLLWDQLRLDANGRATMNREGGT